MAKNFFAITQIKFVVGLDAATAFTKLSNPDTALEFMKDHAGVAGVKCYKLVDGNWDRAGCRRRIDMTNGTRLIETIESIEHGRHFTYRLTEFTSNDQAIKSVIKSGYSQCHFRQNKHGTTNVTWRFALQPHKPILLPATWIYMKTAHRNFMKASVKNMRQSV